MSIPVWPPISGRAALFFPAFFFLFFFLSFVPLFLHVFRNPRAAELRENARARGNSPSGDDPLYLQGVGAGLFVQCGIAFRQPEPF